jgi:multidrug transporter EmrE-like cation transporter
MVVKCNSLGLFGIDSFCVEVEADVSKGIPAFDIVGLPDASVKESKDRVRSALKNCGFDFPTVLCALATAVCLAVELFASLEALKGASLIVNQMFSVGALFIPCIVGIFFFDEPMSVWQWLGLLLFIVAMYFMVSPSQKEQKEKTQVKKAVKHLQHRQQKQNLRAKHMKRHCHHQHQ